MGLAAKVPAGYAPRRPQDTLLYKVVKENLETFFATAESDVRYLPKRVKTELEKFLECGVLAYGFIRVVCDTCDKEILVPFSCKKRGFCPSCCGRRMSEVAIHLTDNVIPDVPVRQYVLSMPAVLRYWCASTPKLLTKDTALFATRFQNLLLRNRIGKIVNPAFSLLFSGLDQRLT